MHSSYLYAKLTPNLLHPDPYMPFTCHAPAAYIQLKMFRTEINCNKWLKVGDKMLGAIFVLRLMPTNVF